MLVYILTALTVKSWTPCGIRGSSSNASFRSYEEAIKDGRDVDIGCNAVSNQTPNGCRRLPLHETTGRNFRWLLCTFISN